LLEKAVKFEAEFPFVNPSRAPLSTVKETGGQFLINKGDCCGQHAVFLTTGVVTECALVKPTLSSGPPGGPPGPPVKRIKLRPFTIEYERAVSFIGNHLNIQEFKTFAGPIYPQGISLATQKEGGRHGMLRTSSWNLRC
jgi:hypothetical protein